MTSCKYLSEYLYFRYNKCKDSGAETFDLCKKEEAAAVSEVRVVGEGVESQQPQHEATET